jgi:hypothetical protein
MVIKGKSGRWTSFMKGSEDCKCPYDDLVYRVRSLESRIQARVPLFGHSECKENKHFAA